MRADWKPIADAPKGEPKKWGHGPDILGCVSRDGLVARKIVRWNWHKNGASGSWQTDGGSWEPDLWDYLPDGPE